MRKLTFTDVQIFDKLSGVSINEEQSVFMAGDVICKI